MNRIYPFFVVAAACLWGSMGIWAKTLSAAGLMPLEIMTLRALFSFVFFCALVPFEKNKDSLKFKLRDGWIFLCTGTIGLLTFNACYYATIQISTISTAVILLYTAPIFVMILSLFIFKEKLTGRKLLALVLAFSGCALVSGFIGQSAPIPLKALIIGLTGGFSYALHIIMLKYTMNKGFHPLTVCICTFAVATIGGLIITDTAHLSATLAASASTILTFITISAILTVLAQKFYLTGLKKIDSSTASMLASVEPVAATILAMIFFSEIPTVANIAGIGLVVAAVILLSVKPAAKE